MRMSCHARGPNPALARSKWADGAHSPLKRQVPAARVSVASAILQGDRGADPCFTTGDAVVPPAAMSRASPECGHGIHLDALLLPPLTAHGQQRVKGDVPMSPRERGDQ